MSVPGYTQSVQRSEPTLLIFLLPHLLTSGIDLVISITEIIFP